MTAWEGVANESALSVEDKMSARESIDLPEWIDEDIRRRFLVKNEVSRMWRQGLVDIRVIAGVVHFRMTSSQAAAWNRMRQ